MINLIDLYKFLKQENRLKEAKIARLSLGAHFEIDVSKLTEIENFVVENITILLRTTDLQEVLQESGTLKRKAIRIAQIFKEDEILDLRNISQD